MSATAQTPIVGVAEMLARGFAAAGTHAIGQQSFHTSKRAFLLPDGLHCYFQVQHPKAYSTEHSLFRAEAAEAVSKAIARISVLELRTNWPAGGARMAVGCFAKSVILWTEGDAPIKASILMPKTSTVNESFTLVRTAWSLSSMSASPIPKANH